MLRRILSIVLVLSLLGLGALAEEDSQYIRITIDDLRINVLLGEGMYPIQDANDMSLILEGGYAASGVFVGRMRVKDAGVTALDVEAAFDGNRLYLRLNVEDPVLFDFGAELEKLGLRRGNLGKILLTLLNAESDDWTRAGERLAQPVERLVREVRRNNMKPGLGLNLFGSQVSEPLSHKYAYEVSEAQLRKLEQELIKAMRKDQMLFGILRELGLESALKPGSAMLGNQISGDFGITDSGREFYLYGETSHRGEEETIMEWMVSRFYADGLLYLDLSTPWFYACTGQDDEGGRVYTWVDPSNVGADLMTGTDEDGDWVALRFYPDYTLQSEIYLCAVQNEEYVELTYINDFSGQTTQLYVYPQNQRVTLQMDSGVIGFFFDGRIKVEYPPVEPDGVLPDYAEALDYRTLSEDTAAMEEWQANMGESLINSYANIMNGFGVKTQVNMGQAPGALS